MTETRYSPKNFIKGKITELIFDQMFREAGRFTILPFGYERTLPELAQYSSEVKYRPVLDNVRSAPDFVSYRTTRPRYIWSKSNIAPITLRPISSGSSKRYESAGKPSGFSWQRPTDSILTRARMSLKMKERSHLSILDGCLKTFKSSISS